MIYFLLAELDLSFDLNLFANLKFITNLKFFTNLKVYFIFKLSSTQFTTMPLEII
jgi:hypothetical protein